MLNLSTNNEDSANRQENTASCNHTHKHILVHCPAGLTFWKIQPYLSQMTSEERTPGKFSFHLNLYLRYEAEFSWVSLSIAHGLNMVCALCHSAMNLCCPEESKPSCKGVYAVENSLEFHILVLTGSLHSFTTFYSCSLNSWAHINGQHLLPTTSTLENSVS